MNILINECCDFINDAHDGLVTLKTWDHYIIKLPTYIHHLVLSCQLSKSIITSVNQLTLWFLVVLLSSSGSQNVLQFFRYLHCSAPHHHLATTTMCICFYVISWSCWYYSHGLLDYISIQKKHPYHCGNWTSIRKKAQSIVFLNYIVFFEMHT